jgi:hypothetical protein
MQTTNTTGVSHPAASTCCSSPGRCKVVLRCSRDDAADDAAVRNPTSPLPWMSEGHDKEPVLQEQTAAPRTPNERCAALLVLQEIDPTSKSNVVSIDLRVALIGGLRAVHCLLLTLLLLAGSERHD